MMNEAIKAFAEQFAYQPEIIYGGQLKRRKRFVVVGMGGSNLVAELLKATDPGAPVSSHRDYGLPADDVVQDATVIASSASGNTEETLQGFEDARARGLSLVAVSMGGELIARAQKYSVPHIILPNIGVQPRMTLGLALKALLLIMDRDEDIKSVTALANTLKPAAYEAEGRALAGTLKDKVPVIYASMRNRSLAYNWKIKFNETGKIPAFYNVFPELNHNEMTGFDVREGSRHLSKLFHFIFIRDDTDTAEIKKRMDVLEKLLSDRKFPVSNRALAGEGGFERIFKSLILADWAAYHTAQMYGLEAEQVPMVEEFKKLIR